jgi:hypothetical protein
VIQFASIAARAGKWQEQRHRESTVKNWQWFVEQFFAKVDGLRRIDITRGH